jgi:hypothetical protein
MKKEDFSLYNYNFYKEKNNKDSLASHPEMTKRIEMLKKTFPELNTSVDPEKPSEAYLALKKQQGWKFYLIISTLKITD